MIAASRRTLLAGSTATLVASPAREAPAHPDARLIGLCARFDALELIIRDAILVADRQGDDDGVYDPGDAARLDQDELLDVMCSIAPATVDGLAALARSLATWDQEIARDATREGACTNSRLLLALVRGLIGELPA